MWCLTSPSNLCWRPAELRLFCKNESVFHLCLWEVPLYIQEKNRVIVVETCVMLLKTIVVSSKLYQQWPVFYSLFWNLFSCFVSVSVYVYYFGSIHMNSHQMVLSKRIIIWHYRYIFSAKLMALRSSSDLPSNELSCTSLAPLLLILPYLVLALLLQRTFIARSGHQVENI